MNCQPHWVDRDLATCLRYKATALSVERGEKTAKERQEFSLQAQVPPLMWALGGMWLSSFCTFLLGLWVGGEMDCVKMVVSRWDKWREMKESLCFCKNDILETNTMCTFMRITNVPVVKYHVYFHQNYSCSCCKSSHVGEKSGAVGVRVWPTEITDLHLVCFLVLKHSKWGGKNNKPEHWRQSYQEVRNVPWAASWLHSTLVCGCSAPRSARCWAPMVLLCAIDVFEKEKGLYQCAPTWCSGLPVVR